MEDDESLAEVVRKALTLQHYQVDLATDGQEGKELADAVKYDLILLDLMVPKLDGISFCKQRRQAGDLTPILLMTAEDTSTKKITGLDAGADDYVVKPFDLEELSARIRALLRRGSSTTTPVLEWGALRLDPSNCQVTYNGQSLRLRAKEYSLLELFLRSTQRIFSQSALLDHLWSFDEPPTENAVRAHIKSLRQKLKAAGADDLIETVYGLGYRLREQGRQGEQGSTGVSPVRAGQSPLEISDFWEQHREKYIHRITVLEQAIFSELEGNLEEALRQEARRQVHTLVGSLGSFGFAEASRVCREIEQIFQVEGKLSQSQLEHISRLVVALRQQLETRDKKAGQQDSTGVSPVEAGQQGSRGESYSQSIDNSPTQLLIVDDDATLALAIFTEATAWGMQAYAATTISKAREAIAHARPDVVLLDLCFSNSSEDGFGLLAQLTKEEPPIPVLVFTAQTDFADRVKVARLGGQGFLQKPVSAAKVMDAISQVLQQSNQPEAKLLIVDDDPYLLDFLRTLLEPWGFKLTLLDDPQLFWNTLEQSAPDLLILDVDMPSLSGIDLCQVVRNDSQWSELPVLFLSARTDAETVHKVFAVGADDYVNKPIVGPELVSRILNRLERTQIRRKLAKIDGPKS